MKSLLLLITLTFTVSFHAHASELVGGFKGGESFANFDILDYSRRDEIGMNFYIDGENDQRYRQVFFNLSVILYNTIMNTNEEVSGTIRQNSEVRILYSSKVGSNGKTIIFETQFLDDDEMIAMKEVTTIVMGEKTASMNIKGEY